MGETVDYEAHAIAIAEDEGYLDHDGEGESALDLLDGAEQANDSIEAKL